MNRCKVWLGNWEVKHAMKWDHKEWAFTRISLRNQAVWIIVFTLTKLLFSTFISSLYQTNHGFAHLLFVTTHCSLCSHFFISFFQTKKKYLRIPLLLLVLITVSTIFCSLHISNVLLYTNSYQILLFLEWIWYIFLTIIF